MRRLPLAIAALGVALAGCGKDHCKPAANRHAELLAPLLQSWGAKPDDLARFKDEFRTLQCAKIDASANSLDCIRDATSLAAAEACVLDMDPGSGDWHYRSEVARTSIQVVAVPELVAYAERAIAAGTAAQQPPPPELPMRCPPAITKLHFLDFRLIAALAAKKDPPVMGTDVLGDRTLEALVDFFVNAHRDAEQGWTLRRWVTKHADADLAIIHVANLKRPELTSAGLAAGVFEGGSLDAAVSVVDKAGHVVCRVPVYAASSAAFSYAYDKGGDKASAAARQVRKDFEDKVPEALERATKTLLGS